MATLQQFCKYFVVVLIGLLVDVGLLYFFTHILSIWYFLAAAISFTTALVSNYLLSITFVFKERTRAHALGFSLFATIGVFLLAVNQIGMYTFVEYVGLSILIAKAVTLPFTFTANFLLNKLLVFK